MPNPRESAPVNNAQEIPVKISGSEAAKKIQEALQRSKQNYLRREDLRNILEYTLYFPLGANKSRDSKIDPEEPSKK
jgi:hypothetical protein